MTPPDSTSQPPGKGEDHNASGFGAQTPTSMPDGARSTNEAWLQAERERLRQMFEQSPGFMAMLRGPKHVFDLVNPAYGQLIAHRDVLGKTIREGLPDLEGQGFYELLDNVFQSGEPFTGLAVPIQLQAVPNGPSELRHLDFVYQPMRDPQGRVAGIFVQGFDVTDSKAAVDAVQASEQRHRQILDSAVDFAIIALDRDGKITLWNEGAHRVLGWEEAEMLGQDASKFFTADDNAADRLHKEMGAAMTRGVGNDERWHLRKSGERFWASGEMTPIHDETGTVTGFVKVLRDLTSKHAANEALRLAGQQLSRAQQAGGVGVFSVDIASDMTTVSAELCRLFGLPPSEVLKTSVLESLVVPEDAAVHSTRQSRSDESAPPDVEYRIRRADDGQLRWISRKAEFEHDAAGTPVRMVGVAQDITERKTAAGLAAESAALFETFAQALPSQAWTATPDGLLDWCNDRVYEYTGDEPGALNGRGWTSAIYPDDAPRVEKTWAASVQGAQQYDVEFRMRRHDGDYRWHLVRAVPLLNAAGAVVRWLGTGTDIHERRIAEDESTRDRDRIWALSQELMLVCDFEGTITAVNPAAKRMLGWEVEDMVGRTLVAFLHPDDLQATADEVGKLSQGATTLAFENRYRAKDGGFRLLNWTAVPDKGFIHAVARDMTRERAAEEALRQSQKLEAVGQLVGGVAHDFNNLLAIIRTSIDVLRLKTLPEEKRPRFLESIANAVTRGAKLTGQLLAFARRQALKPVAFDAGANVRLVGDMVGTLMGARVAVEIEVAEDACLVLADPGQFDTAIVNMAVNARDAMNGAGLLSMSVRRVAKIPALRSHDSVVGDFVAVSLSDTGSGIPADQIDHIFEPFYTTKGVGLGTGLGLSQVFGFAKQSGGDVQVDSVVGEGTTFTLYLPRATALSEVVEVADSLARPQLGRGARVLVVEDNAEVAFSAKAILTEIGYVPLVVHSAADALIELKKDRSRFAVIFSDVVMAGMDGMQLALEIRRLYPDLPVVLTSGYSDVLAAEGVNDFELLPKPYSLDSLTRVLSDAVDGRHSASKRPVRLGTTVLEHMQTRERTRQDELDSMLILDTEEEAEYDEITKMAASFFGAPIALVSLIDRDRQWFKSRVGLQASETPREDAFCAHAIQHPDEVMIVNNAPSDARFVDNPLVTGDPNIRFYAGAPLVTSSGNTLGTLCVIDYQARAMEPKQLEMLQVLADEVVKRMERRRAALTERFASEIKSSK